MSDDEVTIRLSRADFDWLLIAVGYATGAAGRQHDEELAYRFVALSNAINRDNPNYVPYQVPAEFQEQFRTGFRSAYLAEAKDENTE